MRKIFNGIVFDDVSEKIDSELNDWSQICQPCVTKYSVHIRHLDEAGQGTCGVEGCENEADYYIDF
jgi:hypothetical protein